MRLDRVIEYETPPLQPMQPVAAYFQCLVGAAIEILVSVGGARMLPNEFGDLSILAIGSGIVAFPLVVAGTGFLQSERWKWKYIVLGALIGWFALLALIISRY